MYNLRTEEEYKENFLEIIHQYRASNKKKRLLFAKNVRENLISIKIRPKSFPLKYADIRTVYLKKFPYKIHFRIKEKTIIVLGIAHAKSVKEFR